ncbi:hypothetical protein [Litorihabitans aurantiacus]|uniref:Uncharacterized protein n=1 Tax=Litorihabitans aurantiacus TaxID=1930061 RepID=A0AA38CSP4_9MICO|nr:hypothetical protein [Litorihabitans aurantiacus]GMA31599.1 hypothetical protein GCM10025875_15910 [Litorihabitans aurantiacus]
MNVYATTTDLASAPWNLDLDERAAHALLTRATVKVRQLTLTAVYATDPDGRASDPAVVDALRDATCAQAAWFDETGDTGSGAAGRYNTMSLGSASLSGGGTGSGANTTAATAQFSPEAVSILQNAGLTQGGARSW